jgi:hypothetical protein
MKDMNSTGHKCTGFSYGFQGNSFIDSLKDECPCALDDRPDTSRVFLFNFLLLQMQKYC